VAILEIDVQHFVVHAQCFPTYQTAISSPLTAEASNLVTTATPLDTFLFEKPIFPRLGLWMEDRGFSCGWQLQK
jgi:hypothetical protein